jgi:hypothetical protein
MNSDADMLDQGGVSDHDEMEYEENDGVAAIDEDAPIESTDAIDDEAVMTEAFENPAEREGDVDVDVDIADDVVSAAAAAAPAEQVDDPFLRYKDHLGYSSPPRIQQAGGQLQAIGTSARTSGDQETETVNQSATEGVQQGEAGDQFPAGTEPTTSREPETDNNNEHQGEVHQNGNRTLASQDQNADDSEGQSQSQRLENEGREASTLKQHQQQKTDEGSDYEQVNEVAVREKDDEGVEISVDQHSLGASNHADNRRRVRQTNNINVFARDAPPSKKPALKKDLLTDVLHDVVLAELVEGEDEDDEADVDRAPPVLLSFRDEIFSLFSSTTANGQTYPALLQGREDHKRYYDPLESLFVELHELFPSFEEEQMEMKLCVDVLGLEIPEVSSLFWLGNLRICSD